MDSKCNSNFPLIFLSTQKLKFWIYRLQMMPLLNLAFHFLFDSAAVLMSCFIVFPWLPTWHTPTRAMMKIIDVLNRGWVIINLPCVHMISAPGKREVAINWNTTVLKQIEKKHMTKIHTGFGGSLFLLLKLFIFFFFFLVFFF